MDNICGRCYETVDKVYPANCKERPELLVGQSLGQYHCPDCGAMLIVGYPHPLLCKRCVERKHPAFDTMGRSYYKIIGLIFRRLIIFPVGVIVSPISYLILWSMFGHKEAISVFRNYLTGVWQDTEKYKLGGKQSDG